jgi:hypothetical protein
MTSAATIAHDPPQAARQGKEQTGGRVDFGKRFGAQRGRDGRLLFNGSTSDMMADAAALEKAGAQHVILYPQRPTIEETLEVIQHFGEEVVHKQ